MIYTITTNPSLDYTVEAELLPGQINRAESEAIYPGGKGINVSLFLQRLGEGGFDEPRLKDLGGLDRPQLGAVHRLHRLALLPPLDGIHKGAGRAALT